jgi:uncharacterized protein YkwD
MVWAKRAFGWVILVLGVTLLVISIGQVGAQDGTALGDAPQGLVMVADAVDTAVTTQNTSPPQSPNIAPYGATLSPRAYLPIIFKSSPCPIHQQSQAVANFAINDSEQQRPQMICSPILAQVAYEKALDMGTRNYFGHTNPDGVGPNYLVEQAGYTLPSWYGHQLNSNNIESIAAGYNTPTAAWQAWKNSGGHRVHVLGLEPFWREQVYYGIGYAYVPGSTYGHYWVFISAP